MESDLRFYTRRAAEERRAAVRSVTEEARKRHSRLAEEFTARAKACTVEAAVA